MADRDSHALEEPRDLRFSEGLAGSPRTKQMHAESDGVPTPNVFQGADATTHWLKQDTGYPRIKGRENGLFVDGRNQTAT